MKLSLCEKIHIQEVCKSFNWKKDRLDVFLMKIFNHDEKLVKFSKRILTVFHGNSAVERGFSVNKECLVENLSEHSLISQRSVYCAVLSIGGLHKVSVTKSMIMAVRNASLKRMKALKQKRDEEHERQNKTKSR